MISVDTAFDRAVGQARAIFARKLADYGPTWLIFRFESLLDQIWVKLKRLRTLEQAPNLVGDPVEDEYLGIINYCLIGLFRDDPALPDSDAAVEDPALLADVSNDAVLAAYDKQAQAARALLVRKNHDYGNAWHDMTPASITDQMLIKITRARHLWRENREVHENDSWKAQLTDTLNYCVFAMILIGEK